MFEFVKANQLTPNREFKNKFERIFFFPLSRIVIAILFLFPAIQLSNLFTYLVLDKIEDPLLLLLQSLKALMLIVILIYSYRLYTKKIEKRIAFEFQLKNWYKEFGVGFLIGGGMVVFITLLLFLLGNYQIDEINSPHILLNRFFRYAQGSFIEDLLFTIVLFRLLEEFLGTLVAYVIVSLMFGGLHFMNDNATITTSLFISLQEITLLAPFILTRRIWMPWAVHFSWNFFQAGVFGMNNSGMDQDGFITPIITGSEWLTGGAFGIEGSITSVLINLAVGVPILIYAYRKKQFISRSNRKDNIFTTE